MTYTEEIKDLFDSDITSYKIAKYCGLSPQFVDNYRIKGYEIGNMTLSKAEKLADYKKGLDRMEILKFKNLMNTYANEDGTMDLEFQTADKTVFIRNVEAEEAVNDEFYWDDKNNVQKAIDEADSEDIEEV